MKTIGKIVLGAAAAIVATAFIIPAALIIVLYLFGSFIWDAWLDYKSTRE